MTLKHKINELEEEELRRDLEDGYISKEEYNRRLKSLRSNYGPRTKDKHSVWPETDPDEYE